MVDATRCLKRVVTNRDRSSPTVQIVATIDRYHPGVHRSHNGFSSETRLAVNGSVDAADLELIRLQDEIEAAEQRLVAARKRVEARDDEARLALRAEIESTRERLAEMERSHQEALTMIRDAANDEIERICSEAGLHANKAMQTLKAERSRSADVA